jgi:multiple sugar transport system substrate-binding protein
MKNHKLSRRELMRYMVLGGAGLVATACSAQATPEVVEKIVTVEVEKAVEKVVEKEVVVTPTAMAMETFPGARLEMLMRRSFIQAMNQLQDAQIKQWGEAHEVDTKPTFSREWRELTAAAVETKAGGDIAELFRSTAQIYGTNLVDVSELAESLGERFGGWYDVGRDVATVDGVWRAIPRAYTAYAYNYRTDHFSEVGYEEPPKTYDDYLDLATKLADAGLPPVGNSISQTGPNDSASFCYSLLWSYGAHEVEEDGKTVSINSQETRDALVYAQELAKVSAPDITAYDEGSNNRSFLAGEISCTQNATSIYFVAERQAPEVFEAMSHFQYPDGPAGHHQLVELNLLSIFDFGVNKDAAHALVAWLMEPEQLGPLAQIGITFYTPLLSAYDDMPNMPWNYDPKLAPLKGLAYTGHLPGWPGPPSRQSAEAYGNQSLVNMFARVVTGEADIEEAIKIAEDELKAVYGA